VLDSCSLLLICECSGLSALPPPFVADGAVVAVFVAAVGVVAVVGAAAVFVAAAGGTWPEVLSRGFASEFVAV